MQVMGTTIDDACGEAFDKVAKHYDLGYPGWRGHRPPRAAGRRPPFVFPDASLHKGEHRYDVSYSGLKTAVINQLEQFWDGERREVAREHRRELPARRDRLAFEAAVPRGRRHRAPSRRRGGRVAANSYLRSVLEAHDELEVRFPPIELCTDNGAMIAGLGYHLLRRGDRDGFDLDVSSRVRGFRATYP